eukprot:TRINITY_DN75392_c0_g1_i1.p1 TRINITY_DN75392_c0_g1~~TRINITY_DN75392_c0_g1_i1.p1  ORF type:complete len:829 (+),score=164.97 TRINITY_DN75392_c0_g1_i1:86-2572(+)
MTFLRHALPPGHGRARPGSSGLLRKVCQVSALCVGGLALRHDDGDAAPNSTRVGADRSYGIHQNPADDPISWPRWPPLNISDNTTRGSLSVDACLDVQILESLGGDLNFAFNGLMGVRYDGFSRKAFAEGMLMGSLTFARSFALFVTVRIDATDAAVEMNENSSDPALVAAISGTVDLDSADSDGPLQGLHLVGKAWNAMPSLISRLMGDLSNSNSKVIWQASVERIVETKASLGRFRSDITSFNWWQALTEAVSNKKGDLPKEVSKAMADAESMAQDVLEIAMQLHIYTWRKRLLEDIKNLKQDVLKKLETDPSYEALPQEKKDKYLRLHILELAKSYFVPVCPEYLGSWVEDGAAKSSQFRLTEQEEDMVKVNCGLPDSDEDVLNHFEGEARVELEKAQRGAAKGYDYNRIWVDWNRMPIRAHASKGDLSQLHDLATWMKLTSTAVPSDDEQLVLEKEDLRRHGWTTSPSFSERDHYRPQRVFKTTVAAALAAVGSFVKANTWQDLTGTAMAQERWSGLLEHLVFGKEKDAIYLIRTITTDPARLKIAADLHDARASPPPATYQLSVKGAPGLSLSSGGIACSHSRWHLTSFMARVWEYKQNRWSGADTPGYELTMVSPRYPRTLNDKDEWVEPKRHEPSLSARMSLTLPPDTCFWPPWVHLTFEACGFPDMIVGFESLASALQRILFYPPSAQRKFARMCNRLSRKTNMIQEVLGQVIRLATLSTSTMTEIKGMTVPDSGDLIGDMTNLLGASQLIGGLTNVVPSKAYMYGEHCVATTVALGRRGGSVTDRKRFLVNTEGMFPELGSSKVVGSLANVVAQSSGED